MTALKSDGSIFPIEMTVSLVKNKDGYEFSSFIRDLTQQNEYEKSILALQMLAEKANKVKTEFFANMSHELRTPLHGILSFANFGVRRVDTVSHEKLKKYFLNIQTSGERLLVLLNDLLDLSKLESGKLVLEVKKTSLVSIFESCQIEQSQRLQDLGLSIELNTPDKPVIVQCDPIRIGQVITNLLSNAIKFTPQNSQLIVTIETMENNTVRFSLKDMGEGIPEEELEVIFDAFVQSSKMQSHIGSTGLGLDISRKIIQVHQGQIWAENHPHGGAIFTFILPCVHKTISE